MVRTRAFARLARARRRRNDGWMGRGVGGARDRSRGARAAVASSTRGATARDRGGEWRKDISDARVERARARARDGRVGGGRRMDVR